MSSRPLLVQCDEGYTHLFARISEDDDGGYTIQVRLHNNGKADGAAWGEEIADTFESACSLVAALAARYSIAIARVKIDIRMQKAREGTRH